MAKSQTRYATNASNNLINQAQGLTAPMQNMFQQSMGGAQGRQSDIFNANFPALQEGLTTGGYNPEQLANLRSETQRLSETGGFTPEQLSMLGEGGYDPAQIAKLTGGYGELETGGYTPEQAQAFVRQSTEGTQATYGALQDQAKRAQIATGGLGTGGALSQMARQGGQAQARDTLNAEVALNERQLQNKLAGLGGEASLASKVAAGKEAGAGMIQGGKLAGTAAQLGLESGVAGGKLSSSQLMNNLYNTTTGEITDMGKLALSTLGLNFATQEGAIAALAKLSQNPGFFQTMIGDIIGLGGAAAGVTEAML